MKIKKFEQFLDANFSENTYLIIHGDDCVLIDPCMIGSALKEALEKYNLKYVILTHGHYDHIMGIKNLEVPIYVSKDDLRLVKNPEYSYASWMNDYDTYDTHEFKDIFELSSFGGEKYKVIPTPGHTKGSVCIQIGQHLFAGDTLFVDSIGRTDLFSASMKDMQKSLELLKSTVGNETIIYPGHGGYAKFKIIKNRNIYLK